MVSVFEWFAGVNCIILLSKNTRFTAPLMRCGKTKFAIVKWYNLCLQIIQSQMCYSLNITESMQGILSKEAQ